MSEKFASAKMSHVLPEVEQITLRNGIKIPAIGFGTVFPFPINESDVENAVKLAVDMGYRHFDCAFAYCTEKLVGKALNAKIKEGIVKREELFVVSKLWISDCSKDQVIAACKNSRNNMDLDYLDAYLIHYPFSDPEGIDYLETWEGMKECKKLGMTRCIGVSNFNISQLRRLCNHNPKDKPSLLQTELHINLNERELREYCASENIAVTACSPFGAPARFAVQWQQPVSVQVDVRVPEIIDIAEKYGKTCHQIALRYLIDIGTIPLPKASTKGHICENVNVFDFKLTPDEVAIIDRLDRGLRINIATPYKKHKEYPFDPHD